MDNLITKENLSELKAILLANKKISEFTFCGLDMGFKTYQDRGVWALDLLKHLESEDVLGFEIDTYKYQENLRTSCLVHSATIESAKKETEITYLRLRVKIK